MQATATTPMATVVLAVYNAQEYLAQSIDSILTQTFRNFELIIVDDGSTDESATVIQTYSDPRVDVLHNPRNLGKAAALNRALEHVRGRYTFLMDADDIALPQRLSEQVRFMETHPAVGVCSARLAHFGDETGISNILSHHDDIQAALLFGNPIANPAAVIRTALFQRHNLRYRSMFPVEDYDLWSRMMGITRFANLDQVLVQYRRQGQNASLQLKRTILQHKLRIFRRLLAALQLHPSEKELYLHAGLGRQTLPATPTNIAKYRRWLDHLQTQNKALHQYAPAALHKICEERWQKLFFKLPDQGLNSVMAYWRFSRRVSRRQVRYLIKHTISKRYNSKPFDA